MTYITECDAINWYGGSKYGATTGYISAILQSASSDVAYAANRKAYSEFNKWLSEYSDKKLLCRALGDLYKGVAEIGAIYPNAVRNREIRRIAEIPE